jgi:hypothetical protein
LYDLGRRHQPFKLGSSEEHIRQAVEDLKDLEVDENPKDPEVAEDTRDPK